MDQPSLPCLSSDPDIAGIGVRVSVYIQAFLILLPGVWFAIDNEINKDELRAIRKISFNLLVVAYSLLASAFIQVATFGISFYHALVVLRLSNITSISALLYLLYATSEMRREKDGVIRRIKKSWIALLLGSTHLSIASGFGIWIWKTFKTFGRESNCTPYLVIHNGLRKVHVTDPGVSEPWFIFYIVVAAPLVNLLLLLLPFAFVSYWIQRIRERKVLSRVLKTMLLFAALLIVAVLEVIVIADIELTIQNNSWLIEAGEANWTFGQTLAVVVMIVPVFDVYETLKTSSWKKKKPPSTRQEEKPTDIESARDNTLPVA